MSLEAIQQVTKIEQESRDRTEAAEAEARQIREDARRDGEALIQEVRAGAAEESKKLMRQAEERARKRADDIFHQAKTDSDALRAQAEGHLEEAAKFIVGRVVRH